jgi:hypothetical protein
MEVTTPNVLPPPPRMSQKIFVFEVGDTVMKLPSIISGDYLDGQDLVGSHSVEGANHGMPTALKVSTVKANRLCYC